MKAQSYTTIYDFDDINYITTLDIVPFSFSLTIAIADNKDGKIQKTTAYTPRK
jgi:hypothetical protein